MDRLKGKVALVTGGTRGLGEAIALELAREGAKVAVTGRNAEGGQRVVKAIKDAGGEATFFRIDLADEKTVETCVKDVVAHFGALHVLVNNAAPTEHISGAIESKDGNLVNKSDGSVTDMTTDRWRNVMVAGLDGFFWTLKYAIPAMQKSGKGSIVNISSSVSLLGIAHVDAYTATKGAMNAMTRSIAVEYAPHIRCNTVVAGPFLTAGLAPVIQNPATRKAFLETLLTDYIAEPSAIAPAVVYFASDESAYCTGQLLPVDGGLSIKMAVPNFSAA